MTRPLDKVRVVDLTTTVAGPHCTRLLADMGAEVIKVEPPGGETMRDRHPMRDGHSAVFAQFNAGKRSVVLDLKQPTGLKTLNRLIERADVVVENYRPGVMARLGLAPDRLCAENPRLIYCAISGYGQSGPSSHLPAYAPVIHAVSGYDLAHLSIQEDRDKPDNCGLVVADILAGAYAFGAVCAALRKREVTGQGSLVDVSMLESIMNVLGSGIQASQFAVPAAPAKWLYGPLRTRDGFITIAVGSSGTFTALAKAIDQLPWLDDPRFARFTGVQAGWAELHPVVESWTSSRSKEEVLEHLTKFGVPCGAYRTVEEAVQDPQLTHRQALVTVQDQAGPLQMLRAPFQFADADTAPGARVSALGEDSPAIFQELGLSDEEQQSLRIDIRRG